MLKIIEDYSSVFLLYVLMTTHRTQHRSENFGSSIVWSFIVSILQKRKKQQCHIAWCAFFICFFFLIGVSSYKFSFGLSHAQDSLSFSLSYCLSLVLSFDPANFRLRFTLNTRMHNFHQAYIYFKFTHALLVLIIMINSWNAIGLFSYFFGKNLFFLVCNFEIWMFENQWLWDYT